MSLELPKGSQMVDVVFTEAGPDGSHPQLYILLEYLESCGEWLHVYCKIKSFCSNHNIWTNGPLQPKTSFFFNIQSNYSTFIFQYWRPFRTEQFSLILRCQTSSPSANKKSISSVMIYLQFLPAVVYFKLTSWSHHNPKPLAPLTIDGMLTWFIRML